MVIRLTIVMNAASSKVPVRAFLLPAFVKTRAKAHPSVRNQVSSKKSSNDSAADMSPQRMGTTSSALISCSYQSPPGSRKYSLAQALVDSTDAWH
jgi:hypothetical protein